MKTTLTFLWLMMAVLLGAPNEIRIRQRNAADTGFVERALTDPGADSFLRFNNTSNLPDFRTTAQVLSDIGAQASDPDLTTWAGVTPGTGVASALAVNIGSAGAPVLFNGALGTPTSGVGTNITGVNAATLGGATFAAPGSIGTGTPGASFFTTLDTSGDVEIASTAAAGLKIYNTSDQVTNTERFQIYWTGNTLFAGIQASGSGSTARSAYFGSVGTHTGVVGLAQGGSARLTQSATVTNIIPTTASTSTTTGALTVGGGVGIAGTLSTTGRIKTISIKTTTYQIAITDHVIVGNHATVPFTVTMIAASTNTGREFTVKNKGAAAVTVDATGLGQFFSTAAVNTITLNAGDSVTAVSDGATWVTIN